MKHAVATLVVLLLAAMPVAAQPWAEKLFLANGGKASHDFGNVPRGAQLIHRFSITNIYAVNLDISKVRSSCACGTPMPSAKVLEPRQTGYIEVVMDASRFTGPKTISIVVTVAHPEYTSTAELKVSANSRADVVFNPGQINFGTVSRGQTPTQNIDVEYAGKLDWKVSEVDTNGAPLDMTLEEWYRRPGQVGYHVKATLKADAPPGSHKWEVLLKTNDPASPLVPVLIEANVKATLSISSSNWSVTNVKVGEEALKSFLVNGNKPFRILEVEGLTDGFTADLPTASAQVHKITFKFQPKQAGDFKRLLKIKTDLQDAPVIVTVEGAVAP